MRVEGIKYNEVEKFETIKEMLQNSVKVAGDKNAYEYKKNGKDIQVTYKEFELDTNYLGTALATIDMHKKHIAVIGENSYDWITVYITTLKSDGVIVPVDKELTCEEIINVLKSSDSEVLFYSERYEKYLESFQKNLPNIKYYIGFDRKEDEQNALSYEKFMQKGKEEFEKGNTTYSAIEHKDTNCLKMLVFTSGTTGTPKGVMLTEHNLVSCAYYGLQVATLYDKCLSVLPYHHTYEAVAGLIIAIYKQSTVCINDNLKNVLKNLQFYKPDYIYVVPAFAELFYKNIWNNVKKSGKEKAFKILLKVSKFLRKIGIDKRQKLFKSVHTAFGGNLKKIVCGGAPLRAEVGEFFDDIGIVLANGYGISECSPLVSVNQIDFNDPKTVGVVLPCCEIKLENVNEDGDGEICVKGDIVMMGYYKNEQATQKVLKDGWFNTEDYGKVNEKGQLVINGRKKNVIVLTNGKNVYPEEIENYILGVPYIKEVVVRSVKNEKGQETGLCAECFLNQEEVENMKLENVEETLKKDINAVTSELPIYKRITKVEIREKEFVKTTTNKIKR